MSSQNMATPPFFPKTQGGRQGGVSKNYYTTEQQFDQQGRYFWRLVKEAGWTRNQMTELLQNKFNVNHWNMLSQSDRRRAICIMQYFVKKHIESKEKKLRQQINAVWLKAGHSRDELHSIMSDWGYGQSLRALGYKDLCSLSKTINKAIKSK